MTSARRQTFFAIVAVILLFLLLEAVLRVAISISTDYLSRREEITFEFRLWQMHLFDSFMGMHQSDAELFWRLKPNYRGSFITTNKDGFTGPEIGQKEPGELRILFLGDSTPLGLGLANAEQSFVRQLESLLREEFPQRRITVINASVAGYTSWQCRRLLESEGQRLEPDIVIGYFGNNDPSLNGYLSDRELYERTRRAGWLNRVLTHSYLYQLLKNVLLAFRNAESAETELKPRVSLTEAEENLLAVAEWCQTHKAALLICTVPTPYLWPPGIQFKVFARGKDSQGRLVMAGEMQNQLEQPWALCLDTTLLPGLSDQWTQQVYRSSYHDRGEPQEIARSYRQMLQKMPGDPRLLNNLAVAEWRNGDFPDSLFAVVTEKDSLQPIGWYNRGVIWYPYDRAKAERFLRVAAELDHYSLRIKSSYNDLFRRFAASFGTGLIELERLFAGLPENQYYVDHCHPTFRGHNLIAEELTRAVAAHLRGKME